MSVIDQRHPVDVPVVVELKIRVCGPDSRVGMNVNWRLLLSSTGRIFNRPSIRILMGIFEMVEFNYFLCFDFNKKETFEFTFMTPRRFGYFHEKKI